MLSIDMAGQEERKRKNIEKIASEAFQRVTKARQ
jgi:hypothetical protein